MVARLEAIQAERDGRFPDPNYDRAGPVRAYEEAFREYGVDFDHLPAAAIIDRLKARSAIGLPVTAALYDWAYAQADCGANCPGGRPLLAIARELEADPLRHRLSASLALPVTPELQAELRKLADTVMVRSASPSTLTLLGGVLERVGLADVAVRVMQEGQSAHPRDYRLNAQLARLLSQKDDPNALRYHSIAASLRPDSVAVQYGLALTLHRFGKHPDAAACYRQIIELDPTFEPAYYGLGTALRSLKRPEEAVLVFQQGIERRPDSGSYPYGLGAALLDLKKVDEAIAQLRKAIELNPKNPSPYDWLAGALLRQKRYEEAIAVRREAVRVFPKDAKALTSLASVLAWKEGAGEEQIKLYREAIQLDRNHAAAHYGLSRALLVKGEIDEALAECREAIRLKENDPLVHGHLGRVLEKKGLREEAIAGHREVIRLKPDYAPAHQAVGDILLKLSRDEEAVAAYRDAARLDPSPPRFKALAAACDRVVEKRPEDRAGTLAAAAYAAAGDVESYRRVCKELVAIDVARSCLLMPDALAPAELERVRKLAEKAVTGTENESGFHSFAVTRGLSELRAGRTREALEWLQRSSPKSSGGLGDAIAFAVRALAHDRLDQAPEATAALGEARAILARRAADVGMGWPFSADDWRDWVSCQALCREAETLPEMKDKE
jgi:tetratricopeptide (TPR) repeat protein